MARRVRCGVDREVGSALAIVGGGELRGLAASASAARTSARAPRPRRWCETR